MFAAGVRCSFKREGQRIAQSLSSRAILSAELAGGDADFAAEGDAEVFDVVEGSSLSDFVEGEVGFDEEFFNAVEADAEDFFVGGAADEAFEAAFEEGAGLGDDAQNVFDLDAVAGVLADVMDGAGDVAVFNDEDVGGLAGGDAERGDQVGFAASGFAGDHLVEEGGGFVAGAMHVGDDAGEGRVGELAEEFVVINADDGDFVGNSEAEAAAGVEDLLAAEIVAGHDADGFWEAADPFGEVVDLHFGIGK